MLVIVVRVLDNFIGLLTQDRLVGLVTDAVISNFLNVKTTF